MPELTEDLLIDFLSKVSFFSELRSDSLAHLAKQISQKEYRSGQEVFKKGDEGDYMCVIYEGHVRVHDEQHLYNTLHKYDCFGEYALIDNKLRSASVTVGENTTVLAIDRDHFLELVVSRLFRVN